MTAKRLEESSRLSALPQIQQRTVMAPIGSSVRSSPSPLSNGSQSEKLSSIPYDSAKSCLSVQDIKELTRARLAKEAESVLPAPAASPSIPYFAPASQTGLHSNEIQGRSVNSSSRLGALVVHAQPSSNINSDGQTLLPVQQLHNQQHIGCSFSSSSPQQFHQPLQTSSLPQSQSSRLYFRSTVLDSVAEIVPTPVSRPSSRPESSPRAQLDIFPSPPKEKESASTVVPIFNPGIYRSQLQKHSSTTTLLGASSPLQQSPPPKLSLVKQASLPDMSRDFSTLENGLDGSPACKPVRQMQLPEVKQMFSQKEKEKISPSFVSLTSANLRNSNSMHEDDPRLVAMEAYYYVISRDNSKSDVFSSPSMSPRDPVPLQVTDSVLDSLNILDVASPAPRLNRKSASSPLLNSLDRGHSTSRLLAALEGHSSPLTDEETRFYNGVSNF